MAQVLLTRIAVAGVSQASLAGLGVTQDVMWMLVTLVLEIWVVEGWWRGDHA